MKAEKCEGWVTVAADGHVDKVSIPKSTESPKGPDQIFVMRDQGNKRVFRSLAVPTYYLAGAEKKLDITQDWNAAFAAAARSVMQEERTTLNYDRLYTLWQAVSALSHLDAPIVEIGVLRGGSSALLASAQLAFEKPGKIYSCDTFSGHVAVDKELDGKHEVGFFADRTSAADVRQYLGCYPMIEVVEGDIEAVADRIPEKRFSFMHLDVDVYGATRASLALFAEKIVVGGMIVVDDYAVTTCPGAKKAVDEFVSSQPKFIPMHLLTGQMLLTRVR